MKMVVVNARNGDGEFSLAAFRPSHIIGFAPVGGMLAIQIQDSAELVITDESFDSLSEKIYRASVPELPPQFLQLVQGFLASREEARLDDSALKSLQITLTALHLIRDKPLTTEEAKELAVKTINVVKELAGIPDETPPSNSPVN